MSKPTFKSTQKVVSDKTELAKQLAEIIGQRASEAIADKGIFTVGLSGGSMAKFFCEAAPMVTSTDWAKWRLFFVDERLVGLDSEHSTLAVYLKGLQSTPLTRQQNFIEVNTTLPAAKAAEDYASKLRSLNTAKTAEGFPIFDVLLLGMGPDGHMASLFPGHPLVREEKLWVAGITDSPKPPPSRVTLTLPVINSARKCVFAMAGAEKAPMVKALLSQLGEPEERVQYPAALVRPKNGELVLLLESGAAAQISS